jgi:hypothetical protein
MSNAHRCGKALIVLALGGAACLLAPGTAQAINCQYHLNIENQADKSIDVQKIKFSKKVVGDWKPWRTVEAGPKTLDDKAEKEFKKVEDTAVCYRFKWKLQWKCSEDSSWHDYQIPPDDPDNDRVSNWFLLVKGCKEGNVSRSEDGDFF